MKKIIIVDDSEYKRRDIINYMCSIFGKEVDFLECGYRNIAIQEMMKMEDDIKNNPSEYLLILDMCFPNMEDSFPERDEGLHFLFYLKHRKINISTIVCSSEDTFFNEVIEYPNVLGTVKYDSSVYQKSLFEELLTE